MRIAGNFPFLPQRLIVRGETRKTSATSRTVKRSGSSSILKETRVLGAILQRNISDLSKRCQAPNRSLSSIGAQTLSGVERSSPKFPQFPVDSLFLKVYKIIMPAFSELLTRRGVLSTLGGTTLAACGLGTNEPLPQRTDATKPSLPPRAAIASPTPVELVPAIDNKPNGASFTLNGTKDSRVVGASENLVYFQGSDGITRGFDPKSNRQTPETLWKSVQGEQILAATPNFSALLSTDKSSLRFLDAQKRSTGEVKIDPVLSNLAPEKKQPYFYQVVPIGDIVVVEHRTVVSPTITEKVAGYTKEGQKIWDTGPNQTYLVEALPQGIVVGEVTGKKVRILEPKTGQEIATLPAKRKTGGWAYKRSGDVAATVRTGDFVNNSLRVKNVVVSVFNFITGEVSFAEVFPGEYEWNDFTHQNSCRSHRCIDYDFSNITINPMTDPQTGKGIFEIFIHHSMPSGKGMIAYNQLYARLAYEQESGTLRHFNETFTQKFPMTIQAGDGFYLRAAEHYSVVFPRFSKSFTQNDSRTSLRRIEDFRRYLMIYADGNSFYLPDFAGGEYQLLGKFGSFVLVQSDLADYRSVGQDTLGRVSQGEYRIYGINLENPKGEPWQASVGKEKVQAFKMGDKLVLVGSNSISQIIPTTGELKAIAVFESKIKRVAENGHSIFLEAENGQVHVYNF